MASNEALPMQPNNELTFVLKKLKNTLKQFKKFRHFSTKMESLISILRDKRDNRNAQCEKIEMEQELRHRTLLNELNELKDERLQCTETITKNLNTLAGHRHTISKAINESKQCSGLPFSNTHHRQAVDFFTKSVDLINNQNLNWNKSSDDDLDLCKLGMDVQLSTQSAAECFKVLKSSIDEAETLINNIHVIFSQYNEEEAELETSVFDV